MNGRIALATTFTIVLLGGVFVTPLHGRSSRETSATKVLADIVEDDASPGVQYAFLSRDGVLFSYTGGKADLATGAPVTDATTFHGFSVTKTFTAAAVLKLASEGKIDLDAPLSKYLDDFPYEDSPTVRQTLHHTGGFPNPIPISWIHPASRAREYREDDFVRKVVAEHETLKSAPGEKFAYSNLGYLLLGQAIHRVSGKPYADYVADQIIAPLGLGSGETISFTAPEGHARGYVRKWSFLNLALGWFIDRNVFLESNAHEGWLAFKPFYLDGKAYGGLIGNARGFARYLQAILRKDAPFSPAVVERMFTSGMTNDGETVPYAMGWFHGTLEGEPYFAHAGGGGGYYCEIRVYPRLERASVIMFNRSGISDERYLDKVDHFFMGKP